MRFLTTTQLAQLYFNGSRWSANKRLRKLFDVGLLKVWVRSLSQDNIYSITRAGLRLLREHGVDIQAKSPRGLDGNLDHLLAINQVRIVFALGLSNANAELAGWQSDWELRAQRKRRVIPDALFGIRWDENTCRTYCLELDNNTRSLKGFVKKMLGYVTLLEHGTRSVDDQRFVILIVGKDPRWLEKYRSLVAHAHPGSSIWFTPLAALNDEGIDARIWKSACGEARYSLRELSFPPYGREGVSEERPVFLVG